MSELKISRAQIPLWTGSEGAFAFTANVPSVNAPLTPGPDRIAAARFDIEGGKDVGWMKTLHRERRDNIVTELVNDEVRDANGKIKKVRRAVVGEQGVNGISVDAYTRYHVGPRAVDSHHTSFLAEHGNYESWSIRTTVRDRIDELPRAVIEFDVVGLDPLCVDREHGDPCVRVPVAAGEGDVGGLVQGVAEPDSASHFLHLGRDEFLGVVAAEGADHRQVAAGFFPVELDAGHRCIAPLSRRG